MFTDKKFDVFLNKDLQVCVGSYNLTNPDLSIIGCRTSQSMTPGTFTNLFIQFNPQSIVIYFNGISQTLIGSTNNLYGITGRAKLNIGQVNPNLFSLQFDSTLSNQITILDQVGAYGTPRVLPKSFYSERVSLNVSGLPAQFTFDSTTGYIVNNQYRNLSQEEFTSSFTVTATVNSDIIQSKIFYIRIIPSLLILENSKFQNDYGTQVYTYKWSSAFTGAPGEIYWSGSNLTVSSESLTGITFIPPTQLLASQIAITFIVFHANGQVVLNTGTASDIWAATTNSVTTVGGGYRYNNASITPFGESSLPQIDEIVTIKTYNKFDSANNFISDNAPMINFDVLVKSYHVSRNLQNILVGQLSAVVLPFSINYLSIAGGGAGAIGGTDGYNGYGGGGGGGGGYLTGSAQLYTSQQYSITVGAGGPTNTTQTYPSNGANSVVTGNNLNITAIGGGGAGRAYDYRIPGFVYTMSNGQPGGSGGGASANAQFPAPGSPGGSGTPGQGFDGAGAMYFSHAGGGGAGGGGSGGVNIYAAGSGGPGKVYKNGQTYSKGGLQSDGGIVNTGNGGNGGQNGGSGIIIIEYPVEYNIVSDAGIAINTTSNATIKTSTFTAGTGGILFNASTTTPGNSSTALTNIILGQGFGIQKSNFATVNYSGIAIGQEYSIAIIDANDPSINYGVVKYKKSSVVTQNATVEYLVVAGGGAGGAGAYSGGHSHGGGGGAGGLLQGVSEFSPSTIYTLTIGGGGAGAVANGTNGSNSFITGGTVNVVAVGGGRGGAVNTAGAAGGSGGGGGREYYSGGAGTAGQGNDGGGACFYSGGGGGGAGAVGNTNSSPNCGFGGNGREFTQFAAVGGSPGGWFAGGGGGAACLSGCDRPGGLGGGGAGRNVFECGGGGTPGTSNTGGGGGGAGSGSGGTGGGSGIIILKMPSTTNALFSAGLTTSLNTATFGFKIYTITQGTGTVLFS